jgi:hypothetical protein
MLWVSINPDVKPGALMSAGNPQKYRAAITRKLWLTWVKHVCDIGCWSFMQGWDGCMRFRSRDKFAFAGHERASCLFNSWWKVKSFGCLNLVTRQCWKPKGISMGESDTRSRARKKETEQTLLIKYERSDLAMRERFLTWGLRRYQSSRL